MSDENIEILGKLAAKHGTDKGIEDVHHQVGLLRRSSTLSAKNYTKTYGRFFGPLRDQPINFLEIGILQGSSLAMWEDFFTKAQLHAIDIDRSCRRYETPRTSVYIGSQTDPIFLENVVRRTGPLDVVVDDGGHTMEQHRVSLMTLWPHLKSGGMYVIEDLHTAYWPKYGGGGPDSTVEVLKQIIDRLNSGDAGEPLVTGVQNVWFASSIAVLFK
jgi:hypothetical protein